MNPLVISRKQPGDSSPSENASTERLALILDDYLKSIEQGQPMDPEQLLADHPRDAVKLAEYLTSLQYFQASNPVSEPRELPNFDPAIEKVEGSGRRIGDFQLKQEIGRGGMGIVYDAHQQSLGRRVALKILPLFANHDPRKIQRFKNEARAAANVEHPNIVPIHAIGEANGVHYYAMQLIEGPSLASILDKLHSQAELTKVRPDSDQDSQDAARSPFSNENASFGTSTSSTLEHIRVVAKLGKQVADALHAAHECGVVHRDIKPSNLLLDEAGKLWVTDFGLASCRDTHRLTQTGDVLGTMRYMSPEQARGDRELIDHRTDLYSLGVTLYELASLQHPAGANRSDDRLHLIRKEPYQPIPLRSWNRAIPRDFQTIVMKSISEDPRDRYLSSLEMADDLQRFLEGRPILASPPGLLVRCGKVIQRNRKIATWFSIFFIIAFTLQSLNTIRLQNLNLTKDRALQKARNNLEQAHRVLDRFGSRLVDQLATVPGAEDIRYQLLNDSLNFYEQFEAQTENREEWQFELAHAYSKMGSLCEKLGRDQFALQKYHAALSYWQQARAEKNTDLNAVRMIARCNHDIGVLLTRLNRLDESLEHLQIANDLLERLLSIKYRTDATNFELATNHVQLGLTQRLRDNSQIAANHFQATIELIQLQPDSDRTLEARHQLSLAHHYLGSIQQKSDRASAEKNFRQAIAMQTRLVHAHSSNPIFQSDLARSYCQLAAAIQTTQPDQSKMAYRQAIRLLRTQAMRSPATHRHKWQLALTLRNLSRVLRNLDDFQDAIETIREAISIQESLEKSTSETAQAKSELGVSYGELALALQKSGRFEEAKSAFERAIDHQKVAFLSSASHQSRSRLNELFNQLMGLLRHDLQQEQVALNIAKNKAELLLVGSNK